MSDLLIAAEYKAIAQALTLGTVAVNCFGEGDIATSFGRYKQSGFGGRDKSIFAHDQYAEPKTIWIDTTDRSEDETVR
jgi:gamma-glutamyl-gamma-aminobutyraldehyde dehydrogenase